MEQQLQTLERLVTDYFERIDSRIEALENRVGFLEGRSSHGLIRDRDKTLDGSSSPSLRYSRDKTRDSRTSSPVPRFARDNSLCYSPKNSPKLRLPRVEVTSKELPTHTCIQCLADFFEGENTNKSCSYHSGRLKVINSSKCMFSCCLGVARNENLANLEIPGCTRGRHCSRHHSDHPYANYFSYMESLSNNAREIWLEMDIRDPITETSEWGEVGISSEGDVFVLMGSSQSQAVVYASHTSVELKNCEDPLIQLFNRSDSIGWTLIAELHSQDSIANAITLSLKSASYQTPLVKRINLAYNDDSFRPGEVECISDPVPPKAVIEYTVPEATFSCPVLEPGEDYSVARKNDYPTEHSTDKFTVRLKQIGNTTAESSLIRLSGGKWNNLFTATVQISNGTKDTLIKDVFAEYSAVQHKCPKLYTDNDTQFLQGNHTRRLHLGYIYTKLNLVSFE